MKKSILLSLFILGAALLAGCEASPDETVMREAIGRATWGGNETLILSPSTVESINVIHFERRNTYSKIINNEKYTCIEYEAIVKCNKKNNESSKIRVKGEFAFIKRGNKWEYCQQGQVNINKE